MKVSGVAETVTVTHRDAGHRDRRARRRRRRSTSATVETTPILGRKFEDLLTLTPGRQRRPGAGRRRDHVRRPARHLQQHQPRRRRLQQRLLRRAGRRPARRRSTSRSTRSRSSRSSPAARPPSSAARPAASSTSSPSPAPTRRTGALFYFQRLEGADRRALGRHQARRLPPRAVRRHHRRADQEGQGVLLRRARRDHRQLPASEPGPAARRHAVPGGQSRRCRQNEALINANADCQRIALLELLPVAARAGRSAADRASRSRRSRCSARSTSTRRTRTTTCRRPGTSTTRGRRTRRSTSRPTARRPTASKAIRRASTSST